MAGPPVGYRIIELAGIGPGPFAAMMLSDMGAEVLRIDRVESVGEAPPLWDVNARGRRSVGIDLKHPAGRHVVLRLVKQADGIIEGFRPGVTERLGIGPDACLAQQPSLVYGRMTGWGQTGPWADTPGRDINYIALAGTLSMIGRAGEPPVPPLNLVGDFGGGGMLLAFGMVCGREARSPRSAAWCSRRPRRASPGPPLPSRGRRRARASTPTKRWRTGGSPRRTSPRCGSTAPSGSRPTRRARDPDRTVAPAGNPPDPASGILARNNEVSVH